MDRLPRGWVTFVFTDIEGSTRLFQRLGAGYRPLLEEHRRLLRDSWYRHGGVEVSTEGDSFFVAFANATGAVAACLDGQRALAAHPWPSDAAIRVRMGVHSGDAEPVDGDYVALAVHQAARVSATGHGGQVIVSDASRRSTEDALPDGSTLAALGSYRLKDFDEPQPLFQLVHPELPSAFPALRALPATGHNLPMERTAFIGRNDAVSTIAALVASTPLVTLTGPGGVGKTRVALETARRLIPTFGDGVWLVELDAVATAESVASVLASTLGVREEPGRPLTASLPDALRTKRALIVLDNCEHLISACAQVVDLLLAEAPGLAVLATSREPLGVRGERVWSLDPMDADDARRLFVDRASATRHDFAVSHDDEAAVAAICAALEGLPLAVELAAARVSALSPSVILTRLEKRLPLLAGGRHHPDRQRTLRATIDWSYGLLDRDDQELFRQLSVFRGGCSLEAAEAVASADVDRLQSLVEKSLLASVDGRFSMLETIREFAVERLDDSSGAREELHCRHAEYFADAAPALGWRARGSDDEALATIDAEYDNARAAFDWALAHERFDLCARFVEGLWYHWARRGSINEGYRLARTALERTPAPSAQQISLTAELARFSGDLERAVELKGASLAEFEREGAPISRIAADHSDLGQTYLELGALDEAARHVAEGVALRQRVGDAYGVAHAQAVVVQLELARGNHELAATIAEQTMTVFREAGARSDLAWAEGSAAAAYVGMGDNARARRLLVDTIDHGVEIGESAVIVAAIEQAAALAARAGDREVALRLLGAARAGRAATGWIFGRDETALEVNEPAVDEARRNALLAEGEAWSIDEATARARRYLGEVEP